MWETTISEDFARVRFDDRTSGFGGLLTDNRCKLQLKDLGTSSSDGSWSV